VAEAAAFVRVIRAIVGVVLFRQGRWKKKRI